MAAGVCDIYRYANGKVKKYMSFSRREVPIGYYPKNNILKAKNTGADGMYDIFFKLKKFKYNMFAETGSVSLLNGSIEHYYIWKKRKVSKTVLNSKLKKILGNDKIIKFKNVQEKIANDNLYNWYRKNF